MSRPNLPLRLTGLFSEPSVSASRLRGVVTYLLDGGGRLWAIATWRSVAQPSCGAAYRELGDVARLQVTVDQTDLQVQRATCCADAPQLVVLLPPAVA